MKQYPAGTKKFRDHRKNRCVNPHCGKWMELYLEKNCPNCGKRSVERADKRRCDDCHALLVNGDPVCPLCGSKQRTIVELRGVVPENLTAFSHLLHEAQPSVSLKECREKCRTITVESPYRLSFGKKPEQIQPFLQRWKGLGGTAAACLIRETSKRPIVLLRSFNRRREAEHARLLVEAMRKSNRSTLTFGEIACILHSINREEKPVSLCFTSDFDRIDAWVEAWRSLGGTAVRSPAHITIFPDLSGDEASRKAPESSQLFFLDPEPEWRYDT